MASIRKLANGSWQATVYCGRDAEGKHIRKYITGPGEKIVKDEARELEVEVAAGRFVQYNNVRFDKWIEEWLKLNKNRLSPSTYVLYEIYKKAHFNPAFGNLRLSQINEMHIRRFISSKLDTLSTTTVRKLFFVLREILHDVLKNKSPMKDIDAPKKGEYKHNIVTDDDFKKIQKAFKGHKYEAVILLAGFCGMRRGEIFALKWDDIDWQKGLIRVDESKAISNEGYVYKAPKSSNGIRTIAAPKYIMDLLEDMRRKQLVVIKSEDESADESAEVASQQIFPGRPDNFSSRFKEILLDNGLQELKQVRFHDLRHYHASWLYKNKIPDLYAAGRLGHDIQTLKKIYQHLDENTAQELDNNIIKLIESPGN